MSRDLTSAEMAARRTERALLLVQLAELAPMQRRLKHITREIVDGKFYPSPGVAPEQLSLDDRTDLDAAASAGVIAAVQTEAAAPKAKPAATATTAKKPEKAPSKGKKAANVAATATTAKKATRGARLTAAPLPALGDRIDRTLREHGDWYDEGQLQAAIREGEPIGKLHSDRDWRGVLKDMMLSKRIERREEGGRAQYRVATLAPAQKRPVVDAPRPTVTVGEAVNKMLAAHPPERWLKARGAIEERFEATEGQKIRTVSLYLHTALASRKSAFRSNLLDECRAAERAYDAQLVVCGFSAGPATATAKPAPAPAQASLFGEEK